MPYYSQNGYTVIERDDCKFYTDIVDGLSLPLRPDDCGYVLARFARAFNRSVETLRKTETFGHSARRISGSDDWSNHASATAIDANSTAHAYGKENTFSSTELRALRELLEDYDEVIKWGGDYRVTKDEMHFEIDKPYAAVKLLASVHRRNNTIVITRVEFGNRNLDVYMIKRALKKRGLYPGELNKYFGKSLLRSYAEFQRSLGYQGTDADGIPGPSSLAHLGLSVKEV